jgi:AcrR family transcriptional regulator
MPAARTKKPSPPTSRDRVLHAAIEEFSRHGFHNVTIDAIARRARLAKGTVYLYFESKEDLFASLVEHLLLKTTAGLRAAIDGQEDPRQKLRAAVRFIVSYFARNQRIHNMLFTTSVNLNLHEQQALRGRIGRIMKGNLDVLRSLFREGARTRLFRKAAPEDLARILTGMVNGMMMSHVMAGRPVIVEKDVATIYDVFMHGACAGKGTP